MVKNNSEKGLKLFEVLFEKEQGKDEATEVAKKLIKDNDTKLQAMGTKLMALLEKFKSDA